MKDDTLYELNSILFNQLRAMADETLTGEKLNETIRRSMELRAISGQIIDNAALVLKAGLAVNNSIAEVQMPKMIEAPPQKVLEADHGPGRKQAAIAPPKALNG